MPRELERKAWRLITLAKIAVNKTRRKVLIQEALPKWEGCHQE
jgi:hypothetical protein